MSVNFSLSSDYVTNYQGVPFGLTLISGCQNLINPPGFDHHKRKLLRKMRKGEIVLRDERGIVCVLCQGADEKTRVNDGTRNVLFYAYGVPGIEGRYLEEGLTIAADTMGQFGNGTVEYIQIF